MSGSIGECFSCNGGSRSSDGSLYPPATKLVCRLDVCSLSASGRSGSWAEVCVALVVHSIAASKTLGAMESHTWFRRTSCKEIPTNGEHSNKLVLILVGVFVGGAKKEGSVIFDFATSLFFSSLRPGHARMSQGQGSLGAREGPGLEPQGGQML